MEIRPASAADLQAIAEIDGVIESAEYLHIEVAGDGMARSWRVERRPLRQVLVEANRLDDAAAFDLRQIAAGAEEGVAAVAEHDAAVVASVAARVDAATGTLWLVDLRVDYDYRRAGVGTALLLGLVSEARARGLRAIKATTRTGNVPMACMLEKSGFELAGLDLQHLSNHDLVKECVTLFWYLPLD